MFKSAVLFVICLLMPATALAWGIFAYVAPESGVMLEIGLGIACLLSIRAKPGIKPPFQLLTERLHAFLMLSANKLWSFLID